MPLFERHGDQLRLVRPTKLRNEKELQALLEQNLSPTFNCQFVASEFSTGPVHGGRIDTLAISEDRSPVIIEYKVVESSQLINQSLFYLAWLRDHKGDFEVAVRRIDAQLGDGIDWSRIRVICIAPEFKKYDLHAVQMMGADIELWQYKFYENGAFVLEEVYRRNAGVTVPSSSEDTKNPVMVAAGKKAAITRSTGVYTFDEHLEKLSADKHEILESLREFILALDDSVEEVPKKQYVAYKLSQNFACIEVQKRRLLVFLKIQKSELDEPCDICRDVSEIGHFGTGDLEVSVTSESELATAEKLIQKSFDNIGGG